MEVDSFEGISYRINYDECAIFALFSNYFYKFIDYYWYCEDFIGIKDFDVCVAGSSNVIANFLVNGRV